MAVECGSALQRGDVPQLQRTIFATTHHRGTVRAPAASVKLVGVAGQGCAQSCACGHPRSAATGGSGRSGSSQSRLQCGDACACSGLRRKARVALADCMRLCSRSVMRARVAPPPLDAREGAQLRRVLASRLVRRYVRDKQMRRTAVRVVFPAATLALAHSEAAVHAQRLHHALQRIRSLQRRRVGGHGVAAQGAALGGRFKAAFGACAAERMATRQRHRVREGLYAHGALQILVGRRHPHALRLTLPSLRHLPLCAYCRSPPAP